ERLQDFGRRTNNQAVVREATLALAGVAGDGQEDAVLQLAQLAQELGDPDVGARAALAIERLLASGGASSAARAGGARRLARLKERQGGEEGALQWLHLCLEGAATGPVAASAWQSFIEIAARRGDAAAAAQALVAWSDDPRTSETERDRAAHLLAA